MTRSIIFVDDEENLLSGLRRLLRHKRDQWDMRFASSGEQALQMLAEQPADVIVSDMKMPRMDGAQLLGEVRRLHPRTARMILSGHADRMSIISAVGPTQQFLAKPCDTEVLIDSIDRVLAIRDLVTDEGLRELLGGVESLPKPPRIYEEMLAIASDPDSRLEDVVRVIEQDLATSAEVLHLVNSSFFGLAGAVDSVARAVTLLGLETIQGLALAGAIFRAEVPPPDEVDSGQLCLRGLKVAARCRRYAVADGWPPSAVNDAFFAGLLCEIGLPVLDAAHPHPWSGLARSALAQSPPKDPWQLDDEQRTAFGCSMTRATAYLLGLWGFPEAVVAAIADQPAVLGSPSATPAAQLLTVARWRAHQPQGGGAPIESGGYVTPERLRRWDEAAEGLDDEALRVVGA
ncbi:MAG TPA: HDOD domain-containing protein [Kineosporiaceae bacterium]|nr:HDOD domain-containing protein [Kineosporiaceae bacterium]